MWVLLMAVPVAWLLGMEDHIFGEKSVYLVNIPTSILEGIINLDLAKIGIAFPDFSEITSPTSLQYILMFALIGSIESLLTVKAADGLDPFHRKSDMNKDLVAIGIGNFLAGMIGGLPMISEVARSSANVSNGAKTRWANFFHGLVLLVFILFLADLIVMIPKSALAAMLIAVAYRLASPQEFVHTYQVGKEQLLIFLVTLVVTLLTDLLLGVGAGILMKIIVELYWGVPLKGLFKAQISITEDEKHNVVRLTIHNSAIFTNYLGFKKRLDSIPKGKHVIIDLNDVKLIDHTFMENLHHFELEYHKKGGSMEIQGLEHQNPVSDHPLCIRIFDKNYTQKAQTIVLDKRQKELEKLAQENDMAFRPMAIADSFKYTNFRYFYGKKIRYRENRLIKTIDQTRFEFSDMLIFQTGDHLGGRYYTMTALTITDIVQYIPFFVLQKETLFEKLGKKLTVEDKDINFEDQPLFSAHYFLTSTEPEEARKFFTPAILAYFEKYMGSDFMIRSRDSRIMIVKHDEILSGDEIKEIFHMAKGLVEVIKKEHGVLEVVSNLEKI